jgi:hypothetical protein
MRNESRKSGSGRGGEKPVAEKRYGACRLLSHLREISERLHEPLGNVRHHFYRGLERLRKSAIAERLRNYHHG